MIEDAPVHNERLADIPHHVRRTIRIPEWQLSGGHKAISVGNGHGSCVTFFDPDDFDRAAVHHAYELSSRCGRLVALDLGSSPYAPQAIRFALMGLGSVAVDIEPPAFESAAMDQLLFPGKLCYLEGDARSVDYEAAIPGKKVSMVYSARFLSHLPYPDVIGLLRELLHLAESHCRFYLSFSGLQSSLAMKYECAGASIEARYCVSMSDRAVLNDLQNPICLYDVSDVTEKLLPNVGLRCLDLSVSKNGTIRIVASPA